MNIDSLSTKDEAKTKALEIETKLKEYDKAYYQDSSPKVEDSAYDKLVLFYKAILEKFPALLEEIEDYTASVKDGLDKKLSKITHKKAMLSLANAFDENDLKSFIERTQKFLNLNEDSFVNFYADPKMDGLSLSLHYVDGKLNQAVTRGNGKEGEDVTANAFVIDGIVHDLSSFNVPSHLEIRGEVYITKSDFIELNRAQEQNNGKIFANPRNAAAGSLRMLNRDLVKERKLRFIVHGLGYVSSLPYDDFSDYMESLKKMGFATNNYARVCENFEQMLSFYQDINQKRAFLEYDIDGIVYKVNNFQTFERLGIVGKTPRGAIAYKFKAEEAITKINNVIASVGRTGAVTPVAILEPVNVGGALISKATLHNYDEIERKDIKIGDYVRLVRSGDVIPKILGVLTKYRTNENSLQDIEKLTNCPSCGKPLYVNEDEVVIKCTNGLQCKAIFFQYMNHFVSKEAFNIVGLGSKTLELFIEKEYIKKPSDIFYLIENYGEEISEIKGFGSKTINALKQAIDEKRKIPLDIFLYALGIYQVGKKSSQVLASYYVSLDNFLNQMQKEQEGSINNLQDLEGIGPLMAQDIIAYVNSIEIKEIINSLKNVVLVQDNIRKESVQSPIAGKKVVFTGTLSISRQEAKSYAERLGAVIVGSISSKTDYVIIGKDAGSSKLAKIESLNIETIQDQDFTKMITDYL